MLYEWVCHSILDELTGCTSNLMKNAAMDPRANIFTPGAGHHYLRSQTIAPTQRPYASFWDHPARSEFQLGLNSPPGSKGCGAGPPSTMVLIHPAVAACLMAQMASSVFSQASWASISLALMYERVKTASIILAYRVPFVDHESTFYYHHGIRVHYVCCSQYFTIPFRAFEWAEAPELERTKVGISYFNPTLDFAIASRPQSNNSPWVFLCSISGRGWSRNRHLFLHILCVFFDSY